MSPDRLCVELKRRYNCTCNATKLRRYRECFFKNAQTIRNAEFIEVEVKVTPEPQEYTVEVLANQRTRIGIKLGCRIEQKIDDDEPLDAKETQLYSVCCKAADKDLVNDTPEIEYTEDDVEWIDNVSSYT